ncbi:unnamed protein product [Didymodactylos carnosus]|uniref:Uncharacterized protein n=2 Tax=Didymodactylos carnosus TaxID=1234261 RepID=A0A8S2FEL8_9BILA|nr:unnamed protein product [Didymodactylos carnosus]CAF4235458.1 unnamed protein product [Didymodactylos carnosus]
MVNRLRVKLNGHNATVSSSSYTSSSQSAVIATKSKDKQTVSVKKHQHLSENEENDDDAPVLYIDTTSTDAKLAKSTNSGVKKKRMKK